MKATRRPSISTSTGGAMSMWSFLGLRLAIVVRAKQFSVANPHRHWRLGPSTSKPDECHGTDPFIVRRVPLQARRFA